MVKDILGTDLSAGTSFELDDLDQASGQTEVALASASASGRQTTETEAKPAGGATAEVRLRKAEPPRRRSSFWFGVIITLAAVVGLRYASRTPAGRGVLHVLGFGGDTAQIPPAVRPPPAPPPPAPVAVAPPTPPPAAAPDAAPAPAPEVAAPAPAVAAGADASPASPGEPDKPSTVAEKAPDKAPDKTAETPKTGEKPGEGDEPDEEALLRDAVPDAESAVIGEDEAEAAPAAHAAPGKAGAKPRPAAKAGPAKIETAVLQLTSTPRGAIVKTKARVLGRTPIKLHFKAGNTYEIVFVKRGYQPATRRVAVQGTKSRKIAVTLKKRPQPKKSFFHPHR